MDHSGKVANPARGQLTGKMRISLSPVAPENLGETDSAVPSRVSPLILRTQSESSAYSRDSSRVPRRHPFIYLNRHTPSSQSRVFGSRNCVPMVFTARESAGTRLVVVLKVVPITGAAFESPWTN